MQSVDNLEFDVMDVLQDAFPNKTQAPIVIDDRRQDERYSVNWRITIVAGRESHEGRLKDISLHGAAILIHRAINPNVKITLHIHVPPLHPGAKKAITIQCVTANTVHDSHDQCFRVGISFTKFDLPSDAAYLDGRIKTQSIFTEQS